MSALTTTETSSAAGGATPWREQHRTYGSQFAGIYDRLFPAADAARIVDYLSEDDAAHTFAEFGVGTGRVARPLAERGVRVDGVDSSPELLLAAAANAPAAGELRLHRGDIRTWSPPTRVDVACCVCATLSMQPTRVDQQQVLARLADAIVPTGRIVIETHNPQRIRGLHGGRTIVEFVAPVPGIDGGVQCRSELRDDEWQLDHRWFERGWQHAREYSLLTSPDDLTALAGGVGLELELLHSSWDGALYEELSPTFIATLRKSPEGATR